MGIYEFEITLKRPLPWDEKKMIKFQTMNRFTEQDYFIGIGKTKVYERANERTNAKWKGEAVNERDNSFLLEFLIKLHECKNEVRLSFA